VTTQIVGVVGFSLPETFHTRVVPAATCTFVSAEPITVDGDTIMITLEAYQARLIMIDSPGPSDPDLPRLLPPESATSVSPESRRVPVPAWQIGERPVMLPHRWEDDPELREFCGTLAYRTFISVPAGVGSAHLDLGAAMPSPDLSARTAGIRGKSYRAEVAAPVREVARVLVNGTECGVVWAPPYVVEITDALTTGDNELVVEISNTSASRMLDPTLAELCAAANARDGRRFTLQDVSAATDGLSSGLLSVPTLLLS